MTFEDMSESIILLDMVYDRFDIGNFVWNKLSGFNGRYHNWCESARYKEYKIYWAYTVTRPTVQNESSIEFIEIVDLGEVV